MVDGISHHYGNIIYRLDRLSVSSSEELNLQKVSFISSFEHRKWLNKQRVFMNEVCTEIIQKMRRIYDDFGSQGCDLFRIKSSFIHKLAF
jgi:hypothetical protein